METLKFNSQRSTTEEQSKRLLNLGLKSETADMSYKINYFDFDGMLLECIHTLEPDPPFNNDRYIPAWSLDRLLEMIPSFIDIREYTYMFSIIQGKLFSYGSDIAGNAFLYGNGSVYDSAIYTIEWLIKEGYFNKEYLN